MSGPVSTEDCPPVAAAEPVPPPVVEVTPSREAEVGGAPVRRALPTKGRRTVGAWCFADHLGPVADDDGLSIGPHPHIGLQTVTWLVAGEVLHRDSLGSEQLIRPGQLNLMTAGGGIAHSEEATFGRRERHGIQLWVAQPEETRHGEPDFEHHAELPGLEVDGGSATVLVGDFGGVGSPARRDTDHVGVDLDLAPGTRIVPLEARHEYALVVLAGAVETLDHHVEPGRLAYLGQGRDELALTTADPTRVLLLGGAPFPDPLVMWWNFVARTRDEIRAARADWEAGDQRFGPVASPLDRLPAWDLPWA